MTGDRQSQIDRLVESALALEPEERASFLAEACPDPGLFEEVSRIIAMRESSSGEGPHTPFPEILNPDELTKTTAQDDRISRIYGTYRVVRRIGAGGMGEVYLAFDTRLGREVALKFLPAKTSGDDRLVRRFQAEARSASALNHPNILTIFEVGKFDDDHYIASEYVDGSTLRARLRRGPLDVSEVVEIATQIASALMAAHSAGVIHRDLKPTNIMIRPDGYVKVIDFGLAKRLRTVQAAAADEAYTLPGTMVGTVDYMSPEQARGEEVDVRTDLWSFGIILYEMLAGRRPFEGQTQHHVLARILDSEPKPLSANRAVPPELHRVLTRCLQKDRAERYASAADLYADLREVRRALNLSSITRQSLIAARAPISKRNFGLVAGATALCLAAFLWWWAAWGKDRFLGPAPFEHTMKRITFKGQVSLAAISPDGQYVAFVNGSPAQELIVKPIESSNDTPLIPRANVQYAGVTFSNDGHYIYYVIRNQERGQLRKIALTGGDSAFVADDIDGPVAINPAGNELAFRRDAKKLAYVVLTGGRFGAEEQLTRGDAGLVDRRVAWSPRTNRIAIFKYPPAGASGMRIELLDPNSRKTERAISIPAWRGVSQSAWLSNGHDLIVSAETQDETQENMQLRTVSALNGRVRNVTSDSYGYHGASISSDGSRFVTVRWDRQTRFWISPSNDLNEGGPISAADSGLYSSLAWTDDGRLITQANRGEGTNVWLIDPRNGALKKLIAGNSAPRDPVWLPRQKSLAYAAEKNGIWQSNSSDGATRLLTRAPGYVESLTTAADGTAIYYAVWEPHEVSVWVLLLGGAVDGPRMLLHNARHPTLSPDGKYIAVEQSDDLAEGGWRTSVYRLSDMQKVASPHVPVGSRTRWQPDGTGLTYIVTDSDGTSNLWSQPLQGGQPKRLTSFREDQIFDYNWSSDGQHLACLRGTTVSDAFLLTHEKSLLGKLIALINPNSLR